MTDSFNFSGVNNRHSVPQREAVAEKISLLISEIGMLPKDVLNPESHLPEHLGFDSLMLIELKRGITTAFPTLEDLPLSLLLNVTIEELVNFIFTSLRDTSPIFVDCKSSLFDPSVAYGRFQIWKSEFQPGKLVQLEKSLVHKEKEQNVLLARLERLQDNVIIGEVVQNLHHPFFYEHPKDHVPGLYLIEAARQFGTALSHLYYNVPVNMPFILTEIRAEFYSFAETHLPLFLIARNRDQVYLKDRLLKMYSDIFIVQQEEVIAEIGGLFKIFDPASYNTLRSKGIVGKKLVEKSGRRIHC